MQVNINTVLSICDKFRSCNSITDISDLLVNCVSQLGLYQARYYHRLRYSDTNGILYELVTWNDRLIHPDKHRQGYTIKEEYSTLGTSTEPRWESATSDCHESMKLKWIEDLDLKNAEWCDVPIVLNQEVYALWAVSGNSESQKANKEEITSALAIIADIAARQMERLRDTKILELRQFISEQARLMAQDKTHLSQVVLEYLAQQLDSLSIAFFKLDPERGLLVRQGICYRKADQPDTFCDLSQTGPDLQYEVGGQYLTSKAWQSEELRKFPINLRKLVEEKNPHINFESVQDQEYHHKVKLQTILYAKLDSSSFMPGLFRITNRWDHPKLQYNLFDTKLFNDMVSVLGAAIQANQSRIQIETLLDVTKIILSAEKDDKGTLDQVSRVSQLWGMGNIGVIVTDKLERPTQTILNHQLRETLSNTLVFDVQDDKLVAHALEDGKLSVKWFDLTEYKSKSEFANILYNHKIKHLLVIPNSGPNFKGLFFCVARIGDRNIPLQRTKDIWLEFPGLEEVTKALASVTFGYLEAKQKHLSVAAAQSMLINVGHEFRSPAQALSQIATRCVDIAKDLINNRHNPVFEELDKLENMIEWRTESLQKILMVISNVGTSLASTVQFDMQPNNILDIITDCAVILQKELKKRGARLLIRDNVAQLPICNFDAYHIEQVFANIIENAIKYSHVRYKGQPIDIEIVGERQTGWNILHVTNWGQGIDEEEQTEIFKSFYRTKRRDTRRLVSGFGMGLSVCKAIIDAHGGRLKVKSVCTLDDPRRRERMEGYLTTFSVFIPTNIPKGFKEIRREG